MTTPARPIEDVEMLLIALLDTAAGNYEFLTKERKLEFKAKEYPAIYVWSPGEEYQRGVARELPPQVLIEAEIWIYADHGSDVDGAPETQLNLALRAVKRNMEPSNVMTGVQQLGLDWVSHCWIEGRISKFPGFIDNIAKATIPIKILLKGGPQS
jgi:hypothetical protein